MPNIKVIPNIYTEQTNYWAKQLVLLLFYTMSNFLAYLELIVSAELSD